MSEIILASSKALTVPLPKEEVKIREGNPGDIRFIDDLQKQHSKQLGFMFESWLVGKIEAKQVLIAEIHGQRVGYIIAQDHYLKRQELGIVYQLVVTPVKQRSFIGAALLKAQFDRSAYGCRLYCCWCAQDLDANHFWEAMGFYPLAFRMGSEKRGKNGRARVHIFWEKKIRGKDDTINWWFPHKTDQGAMRADRLVFPIPPNTHWNDIKPVVLPVEGKGMEEKKALPAPRTRKPVIVIKKKVTLASCGLRSEEEVQAQVEATKEKPKREKPDKQKVAKKKIDPKFISKAREFRDKYLEQVNEHGYRLESTGKYDLTKDLTHRNIKHEGLVGHPSTPLLLEAA